MKNTAAVNKGYLFFLQMKKDVKPEFEKALSSLSFKDRVTARKFMLSCRNFEFDDLTTWCSKFPYPESVSIALSRLSEAMTDLAERYRMAWFTRKNGRLVPNGSGEHNVVLPPEERIHQPRRSDREIWERYEYYIRLSATPKNTI